MDLVAVGFWIATGLVGAYMAGITFRTARPDSPARETHLPPLVVFTHASAALLGLGVYIVHLLTDIDGTAWVAFGVIIVTATLGGYMMLIWRSDRRGTRHEREERTSRVAEQQIPSIAVHVHGALATATILLVLLVAWGVGG